MIYPETSSLKSWKRWLNIWRKQIEYPKTRMSQLVLHGKSKDRTFNLVKDEKNSNKQTNPLYMLCYLDLFGWVVCISDGSTVCIKGREPKTLQPNSVSKEPHRMQ